MTVPNRNRAWRWLFAAAIALTWGAQAATAADSVKSQPDVVIYRGSYPGWPWVAAGSDGTLYCVFREGTVHGYSAEGKAMLSKSTDHGRTWSAAQVIIDVPENDDRNVAIVELPNRDLLVTYNTYSRTGQCEAMAIRSSDQGKTWRTPRPVGRQSTRTKSAAVALAGGAILLPFYSEGPGAVRCSLAGLSADGGDHWQIVEVPNADGFVGDEWDVLEVTPGRLIGLVRNEHPKSGGTFWKTESRDGGRTWAAARPTNVRSDRHRSPPQLARQGGTPTLIYSDRRMVSVCAARSSDPEFLRWDTEHRVRCYVYNRDESPIRDGSYPVSAGVGGNRRLVVDYEIRNDRRQIAGYFVDFPAGW